MFFAYARIYENLASGDIPQYLNLAQVLLLRIICYAIGSWCSLAVGLILVLVGVTLVIGLVIRVWLLPNQFVHYDDMWGAYRALVIHGKDRGELLEKLPDSLQSIASQTIDLLPFGEYAIKHLSAVHQASYMTTLAPLHYIFSLAFIPAVDDYQAFLIVSRFFSLLEYLLFVFIFIKAIRLLKSRTSKAIGYLILLLSAMSGMMIYYSVQGHNYMASVPAMAALLFWIKAYEVKARKFPLRAFSILYSISILISYSFIIYLPAYILVYVAILANSRYFKAQANIHAAQYLYSFGWLILPIVQSFLLKRFYIMPSATGAGWQSGFNNEYIIVPGDRFAQEAAKIFPAIRDSIGSVFLYQSSSTAIDTIFVIAVLLIVAFSFVVVLRQMNKTRCYSLLFAQGILVTHFALYLCGVLALSPTRHSLILFPVISWILMETSNSLCFQSLFARLMRQHLPTVLCRPNVVPLSSAIVLSCYSVVATISLVNEVRLNRLDPVIANSSVLDSSRYIVYAPYYNFGVSIYSILNGKRETLVPLSESNLPGILLGDQKDVPSQAYFLYVTNDPLQPSKTIAKKYAGKYQCLGNPEILFSQSSQTIVDPVKFPITSNGTNSLHVIKVDCLKSTL